MHPTHGHVIYYMTLFLNVQYFPPLLSVYRYK